MNEYPKGNYLKVSTLSLGLMWARRGGRFCLCCSALNLIFVTSAHRKSARSSQPIDHNRSTLRLSDSRRTEDRGFRLWSG